MSFVYAVELYPIEKNPEDDDLEILRMIDESELKRVEILSPIYNRDEGITPSKKDQLGRVVK